MCIRDSHNAYKYNVEFYDADPIISMLPDLILSTSQTINDWESGHTNFRDTSLSFDFSAGHTYFGQIIDHVNNGHRWLFNDFYSEPLGFTPMNYPSGPIPSVQLYSTTPVPEPSSLLLFGAGLIVGLAGLILRKERKYSFSKYNNNYGLPESSNL